MIDLSGKRALVTGANQGIGWAIAKRIQQVSNEVLQVSQGALYPALHRLEQQGWIRAEWRVTEGGKVLQSGERTGIACGLGQRVSVGEVVIDAPAAAVPRFLALQVELWQGTKRVTKDAGAAEYRRLFGAILASDGAGSDIAQGRE